MPKLFFEDMKEAYLDEVFKIEEVSYGEHHWSKDSFRTEIKNSVSNYVCAFLDDETGKRVLVGYCGMWQIFEEAHITTLAIHPDYRGKKIAQALLIHMFENLYKEKIKFVTLEVRISNTAAIKLYEKFGFKSLGVRKKYYQNNNEDALIMWTNNIFSEEFKSLYNKIKEEVESASRCEDGGSDQHSTNSTTMATWDEVPQEQKYE